MCRCKGPVSVPPPPHSSTHPSPAHSSYHQYGEELLGLTPSSRFYTYEGGGTWEKVFFLAASEQTDQTR